jgi:manganese oxidase
MRVSLCALLLVAACSHPSPRAKPPTTDRVLPNDNRDPDGTLHGGVLTLRLEARVADWYPDGDDAPGAPMMAFAQEGGPARIPGPLVRVAAGTEADVRVRNTLNDTLRVYGLHTRPFADSAALAPLILPPGESHEVRFRLEAPGTYLYWATTMRRPIALRTNEDAQLSGAIVVDPPSGPSRDRILVIGSWSDTVHRAGTHRKRVLAVINGRSWPHTERLEYAVGGTVRWRLINASADLHPMHLHGFYFRVTSRGDGSTDSIYPSPGGAPAGELAVTETMLSAATVTLEWVPERPGNWLFHCHVPEHVARRGPLGTLPPTSGAHVPHDHAQHGMNGLVLGVTVRPGARTRAMPRAPRGTAHERHLRLLVRTNVGSTDAAPFFGYALHEGGSEPPADTGLVAAPTLDLVRGEPVRITVVNRLAEPTAVHWHGIELESYFDGVPGFSGMGRQVTPLIAPGDSFEVRFAPPRAGTFIYHTHVDEQRQQHAGLAGALVVREPGTTRDPAVDVPLVITSPTEFALNRSAALVNGRTSPPPLLMTVGRTYRLRLIQMAVPRVAATVEVHSGDTLAVWRPVAKDGAELPAERRTLQPARTFITVGETGDFEITPTSPGELRLEVRYGGTLGPSPGGPVRRSLAPPGPLIVAAIMPIRVTPSPSPQP